MVVAEIKSSQSHAAAKGLEKQLPFLCLLVSHDLEVVARQVEGLQGVARGLDERSQASQRFGSETVFREVEINQSQVSACGEGILQAVSEKSKTLVGQRFVRDFQVKLVKVAVL
jgi:hypothetical protein